MAMLSVCFYLQFSGLKARHAVVLIRLVIKVLFNDACLMKSPASIRDGLGDITVRVSSGGLGCEEGLCCVRGDKGNRWGCGPVLLSTQPHLLEERRAPLAGAKL